MACECATKVDEKLNETYPGLRLARTITIGPKGLGSHLQVATASVIGMRKYPKSVTPSYCPFCGVKYFETEKEGKEN